MPSEIWKMLFGKGSCARGSWRANPKRFLDTSASHLVAFIDKIALVKNFKTAVLVKCDIFIRICKQSQLFSAACTGILFHKFYKRSSPRLSLGMQDQPLASSNTKFRFRFFCNHNTASMRHNPMQSMHSFALYLHQNKPKANRESDTWTRTPRKTRVIQLRDSTYRKKE